MYLLNYCPKSVGCVAQTNNVMHDLQQSIENFKHFKAGLIDCKDLVGKAFKGPILTTRYIFDTSEQVSRILPWLFCRCLLQCLCHH